MADLSKVLGGPWAPPQQKRVAPPEEQLIEAMVMAGLEPPLEIHIDGKLHRFRSGTKGQGKGGDKPGWYVIYGDGIPAGRFGCWRSGIDEPFKANVGRELSPAEEMAHAKRMAEAKAARDADRARQHEVASATVEAIWSSASYASPEHPYLKRKGIGVHGVRITGDGRLMLPLLDEDGQLSSLQYIDHEGGKLYHPGGQTGLRFWMVGLMDEPGTLYVAEGFATAATIHEATGRPCIVSYSASNLVPVVGIMRERLGLTQDICIVADHDKSGVGQRYAEQACAKHGARYVMPPIEGMDANDYAQAGNDLAGLLAPTSDGAWLIHADDFSAQPAPISWLVKGWLQDQALIMVHGPSGGGKTFVVLDWCLRIASKMPEWMSCKVKSGNVVYLAGEGHHGLRARIAGWKHHHGAASLSMWLSKEGCDLNTPEGYTRVSSAIKSLPVTPSIIVVDTLHRFLAGDENSAQDAKTMLDACGKLMQEFGCSVLLVHHTGVSDEAQHRARGSSAWRGALDIEISIVPAKDDKPMEIVQRKSKDAEMSQPKYARLESVDIPGWFDEDGEAVTTAVLSLSDAPVNQKVSAKLSEFIGYFKRAWFATGAEHVDGMPFVRRSPLVAVMPSIHPDWKTEKTVANKIGPSGEFTSALIDAGIIEPHEHIGPGWRVKDNALASQMMLCAKS